MDSLYVLVVDDEPAMRSGVTRALRDAKFIIPNLQVEVVLELDAAGTGEEALEKIAIKTPDVLLLDNQLPGVSGLEVLDCIQDKKDDIHTIMITAYASLETAVTAIKSGAYDFLAKPFTPRELKATIQKAVENLVHARQARQLAREKRQVRFQFISVLAHELKAPIAAVEGYLDIIRNRTAGDDQSVYDNMLDRCNVRIDGMRKMICDLLDLTRIESGQKLRRLCAVDVTEAARFSMESIAHVAGQSNITVNLHAPDAVMINGDRGEMEIILNNLVSNAVKYNRPDGTVDITIKDKSDKVLITVADTGIGMEKQDVERLFGDFVRIKTDKTKNILGSGLGLSILKKLCYLYDGVVKVHSEPNVGTTFTVTLMKKEITADDTQ